MIFEIDQLEPSSIIARRHFSAGALRLFGIFSDPASWQQSAIPRITSSHQPNKIVYSFDHTERATVEFEPWSSDFTQVNLRIDGFIDAEASARQRTYWSEVMDLVAVRVGRQPVVVASSPAKINIFFGVGAFLKDGYHTVASCYQALQLREQVSVEVTGNFQINFSGPFAKQSEALVPKDRTNLVYRAVSALAARYEQVQPDLVAFHIHKSVPIAGGMAGGSADAAAALVGINDLFACEASNQLEELASGLGADIPFALTGGTAVGLGKGEKLAREKTAGVLFWVVTPSSIGLSTPEVYRKLDTMRIEEGIDPSLVEEPVVPQLLLNAVRTSNAPALAPFMHNDLERAALALRPQLRDILQAGEEAGALRSMVSGSGPTIIHLVKDRVEAQLIAQRLTRNGFPSIATYSSNFGTLLEG